MSDERETEQPATETQASETQASETQASEKRAPKRWRDDSLSVFLGAAAVVLGLMYFVESRQQSTLERQELRAAQLVQEAGIARSPACRVGTAGASGEVLVVACQDRSADTIEAEVRARLQDGLPARLAAAGFERVAVHGSDGRRVF